MTGLPNMWRERPIASPRLLVCRCRTAKKLLQNSSAACASSALKGAEVLTNVAGRDYPIRPLPFWAKAEELGALVVIHPNGFTEAKRLSRFYFNNVVGNPLETALALHYRIFDGVLERHPNQDPRGSRRRISRRLQRTHRSRVGRAVGLSGGACRTHRPTI